MEPERIEPEKGPSEVARAARSLAQDLPLLVREEADLLRAEVQGMREEAASRAKFAAVRAGVASFAGFLLAVGAVFLALSVSMSVSERAERPWAGPLVAGVVLVAVATCLAPLLLLGRARPGRA